MYTSLRTISVVTIICAIINAIAALLVVMLIAPIETIEFTLVVAVGGFMGTTSLVLIIVGIALWNFYDDLDAHNTSNYEDISALRKRVEVLENNQ